MRYRKAGAAVRLLMYQVFCMSILLWTTLAIAISGPGSSKGESSKTPNAMKDASPDASGIEPEAMQPQSPQGPACSSSGRTVTVNVVALDQPFMLNRLGASMPQGMIFSLLEDIVPQSGTSLTAGNAVLRADKRPRPLVLRMSCGDSMTVQFWNLLSPQQVSSLQPVTRDAGVHAMGMQLTGTIASDGSNVGANASSLVPPLTGAASASSPQVTYKFFAQYEGTFLLYSTGATFGDQSNHSGQLAEGLFGAVNVAPPTGEAYRSQITNQELQYAIPLSNRQKQYSPSGQPLINYQAHYPPNTTINGRDVSCLPVLKIIDVPQTLSGTTCSPTQQSPHIFYSDLTAIITGPNAGVFNGNGPWFNQVPASPNRTQPYREFTIIYHDMFDAQQAFYNFFSPPFDSKHPDKSQTTPWPDISNVLGGGSDQFAINYGTGGIGAEILANRLGVGPMWNCVECKFEEFFLSSWAVGDPSMVVDVPANTPTAYVKNVGSNPNVVPPDSWQKKMEDLNVNATPLPEPYGPQTGAKATVAYFADDPSNVYHSYLNDHVKFRILHAGSLLTHVHHQHAHQWQHTPNDPNGSYLDSQLISPGSAFTLEVDYGGSGNRNKTLGDSIFHCHFYAHFADGMWGMWRVHDVLESGTQLDGNSRPTTNARALPDGEISAGTPIPAVVPVPTQAMAPLPAYVFIKNGQTQFKGTCQNNTVDGMTLANGATCTNGQQYYGQVVNGNQFLIAQDQTSPQNPGYPFFIPGIAGHRPPHPPLDFACKMPNPAIVGPKCLEYWDGGLPRHVVTGGTVSFEKHNLWDFTKNNGSLNAEQLPEAGTPEEQAAMKYNKGSNGKPLQPSFAPDGTAMDFRVNGLPNGPQSGAPFADPAVNDDGTASVGTNTRVYKAADIQMDAVFSKKGWHHPQERLITLWDDVLPTINGAKAPEPFFFRANSKDDVIEFWQTNLIPDYYQLDDFQVQTPTDIVGQHIHLVKFDVLASDGAANGFNYEDGTFSPEEVQARYAALTATGGSWTPCSGCTAKLSAPQPPPTEIAPTYSCTPGGNGQYQPWCGAQTTIQRWYPDPLQGCFWPPCKNNNGDRTLRTVFTHDHFGPSTHQQAGLYAGLLVEPQGSQWWSPDGKTQYGSRSHGSHSDGGPTSWEANVIAGNKGADSYREFALEFQDLALTYEGTSTTTPVPYPSPANYPKDICDNDLSDNPHSKLCTSNPPSWGWADCANAINSPALSPFAPLFNGSEKSDYVQNCTATDSRYRLQPQIVSANLANGTSVMNYRSEPLQFRVYDPNCNANGCKAGHSTSNPATDLSQAFSSLITRNDPCLNGNPSLGTPVNQSGNPWPCTYPTPPANPMYTRVYPGPFTGANNGDPYTPLMRAYMNDRVQVRLLVGAHLAPHSFGMHGLNWYFEPSNSNSGYRDNQSMGISEHFELQFTSPPSVAPQTDYLYGGFGLTDLSQGLWGLFRSYNMKAPGSTPPTGLAALPNNLAMGAAMPATAGCPANAKNVLQYYVAAINVPGGLNYNSTVPKTSIGNPLGALVYVQTDQNFNPLKSGTPTEPLILRASAGDCIQVTLKNAFTNSNSLFTTADTNSVSTCTVQPAGTAVDPDCATSLFPSVNVGLHTQLVSYDASVYDGLPVGSNALATGGATPVPVLPGGTATYSWYAGTVVANGDGTTTGTPVEFGSVNLLTSDPMEQQPYAMVGALIIEPQGASWNMVNGSNLTADVTSPGGKFREFVSVLQDNVYLQWTQDGEQTASDSINYTSNPMTYRFDGTTGSWNSVDLTNAFSNTQVNNVDPPTIFQATVGSAVRFRMLHPDGYGGVPDNTITLHGHAWAEEPYVSSSSAIGLNPNSQWLGSRDGFGPQNHFDIVIPKAGGENGVTGDYLLESFHPQQFTNGAWGIFRVTPTPSQMRGNVAKALGKPKAPPKRKVVALPPPARKHADPADRFLIRKTLKPVQHKTEKLSNKSGEEKKH